MAVDLSQFGQDDRVAVTLENGETFEGVVLRADHEQVGENERFSRLTLEGPWWDQIKDRVDSEILYIDQMYHAEDSEQTAVLLGTEYIGRGPTREEKEVTVGGVSEIEDRSPLSASLASKPRGE